MSYELSILIDSIICGYGIVTGALCYSYLDRGAKIILYLIILSVIAESIAIICAYTIRNNYYVYGVFNPVQLVMISLYYNTTIKEFKRNNIGVLIGVIAALYGVINYLFIQSPNVMNSNFLLIEGLCIVAMSLYSFYRTLLDDDDLILLKSPHFWFSSLLMFFWTSTFLIWGMYDYFRIHILGTTNLVHMLLLIVNVITYIGFGTVFLLYKKMQTTDGR